ncbi:hypothetical protein GCM10008107_30250 [Psychrosphaera saromensis]|nr:hypothetical protein GCM10008107_30250 [Psychrosphaera saromensis]GLQ14681.1 hypothetical protein GCM10007917_21360 [Psychrosphaera saromensis]
MCICVCGSWSISAQQAPPPSFQSSEPISCELSTQLQSVDGHRNKNTIISSNPQECILTDISYLAVKEDEQEPLQNAETVDVNLEDIEKVVEEERLKVLFVDVNSVVEGVGYSMDWTANLLDGLFAENESGKNKAKTWGHFILGWEPREGEVFTGDSFPIKFKIKAKLPNLENSVELILSDGEDDDFKTLPYESVKTEAFKLSQSSLGAAVRFLHTKSDNLSTSVRIGWGEDQLYTRASGTYRQKFFDSRVIVNLQPAIEYYVADGWGARFLLDTGLKINKTSEVRYNLSLRDLESYNSSEWRSGLFQITALTDKSALITGISSFGYIEPKVEPISHKFSVRYRFNALRSWLFFEIEPFVELNKDDPYESESYDPLSNDFVRNTGISFRIETHYGFL